VLWLFLANVTVLVPYALWCDRKSVMAALLGALQLLSYGIALWTMTLAPIALVASLRETSVLFGVIIAVLVVKEPLRTTRVAAVALIVSGLVLIRLQ
jgi:drug/metabolite transporter (DMT)-like permease